MIYAVMLAAFGQSLGPKASHHEHLRHEPTLNGPDFGFDFFGDFLLGFPALAPHHPRRRVPLKEHGFDLGITL